MSRRWQVAAVAVAAVLLLAVAGVRVARLANAARWSVVQLQTRTEEQRRVATYGDCGHRGYGYLRRVVDDIPEPDFMPELRYQPYSLFADRVVPCRRRRSDSRVLVSIGLVPADLEPMTIHASPVPVSNGAQPLWRFEAGRDIDSLVAFVVDGRGRDAARGPIGFTLYETLARKRVLGQWEFAAVEGAFPWTLSLPAHFHPLARSRGEVSFVIEVTAQTELSRVELIVRPVDFDGYTEVARSGECATLVQQAFLDEINDRPGPWSAWLARLRGSAK